MSQQTYRCFLTGATREEIIMRGSSNVRKYLAAVKATPAEGNSEYSRDYRASVIDTLGWMLGEKGEHPIALSKKAGEKKAAAGKPKQVRAPRAFPKEQQVQG